MACWLPWLFPKAFVSDPKIRVISGMATPFPIEPMDPNVMRRMSNLSANAKSLKKGTVYNFFLVSFFLFSPSAAFESTFEVPLIVALLSVGKSDTAGKVMSGIAWSAMVTDGPGVTCTNEEVVETMQRSKFRAYYHDLVSTFFSSFNRCDISLSHTLSLSR